MLMFDQFFDTPHELLWRMCIMSIHGIKSQDFISMDECYSPVFMYHVVSSEADGHISCWNLSTIVKSATVDTGVWYIWLLDNLNLIKTGSFSFLCFMPVALDLILQKTIID